MFISYTKVMLVSQPALAMSLEGICIMENMTQYGEFRCVFWSCDIDMYVCFYMVSVTITLEIFKIRYYMYYALFDSLSKLLLYLSHKCYV